MKKIALIMPMILLASCASQETEDTVGVEESAAAQGVAAVAEGPATDEPAVEEFTVRFDDVESLEALNASTTKAAQCMLPDGSHVDVGTVACLGGKIAKCKSNGKWTFTGTPC